MANPSNVAKPATIDVERMLAECVPGGSSCDPQLVADAIRSYFASAPASLSVNADQVAEVAREELRAALDKWETTLSAVMPADYKDWHESDRSAWPELAASCIVNARRMAEADGVLINAMDDWRAAVEAELNAIHDTADSYQTPQAAIRALINWHCAVQIDPAVSSDAAALVERGRREALGAVHE